MKLRYDVLNKKRRPAIGHSFARGFLPNGGHPLVLFRWNSEVRGKIGNLRAQPDFCQQNRRSWKPETGDWSVDFGFPRTSGTVDGSMRQIPESPSTPLFSCKVTAGGSVVAIRCGRHAGILPHTSGWTQINGVNAHGLECHIELPIGNKTNIVSIMLTKGWL